MKTVYSGRLLIEKDGRIDRRAIIAKLENLTPLNGAECLFLAETLTRLWLPKSELRAEWRQYRLDRIERSLEVAKQLTSRKGNGPSFPPQAREKYKEKYAGQSVLEVVRKRYRFPSVPALKRWLNDERRKRRAKSKPR